MKKQYIFAISIILLVFLAGCRSADINTNTNKNTQSNIRVQQPGTYVLRLNEGINVGGKAIKLIGIDSANGRVSLDVDGISVDFSTTRIPKIVRNLEIQTIRVDYGKTLTDYSATIEVKYFTLGENEYYLSSGESVTVAGTNVEFADVTKVGGVRLTVAGSNTDIIIDAGNTQNVKNLAITNVRTFNDPVRANRFALLRITEGGAPQ